MTAENELAVGFLWAVAYMFLLVGVFGFGACWLLKDTVRWVLREPHLRWHRAGRLVGGVAAVGGLGTMSAFLGDTWALTFVIVCAVLALVNVRGAFSGTARRSVEICRLAERRRETLPADRGEDHG